MHIMKLCKDAILMKLSSEIYYKVFFERLSLQQDCLILLIFSVL